MNPIQKIGEKLFHCAFGEIGDNAAMETSEKRQRGRPRAFHGPSEAGSVQSLDRALRILAMSSLRKIVGWLTMPAPHSFFNFFRIFFHFEKTASID